MQRITDKIYTIEGLRVGRVYVIVGNDGLTLIDTSLPNSLPRIEVELKVIGKSLSDIKRILITHAHYDHIGSLAALQAASGAKVYAHHRYESAVIRGEKSVVRPPREQLNLLGKLMISGKPPDVAPVQVDYELKEGDLIDEALPGLQVIDEPGHSPGQCGFWQPDQRLLFCGDVMARIPFSLNTPPAAFTPDMDEAKRSIHKVAELGIATLCLGHGNPYIGNADEAVRAFAAKLR